MGFYEKFEDLCYKRNLPLTTALTNCGVNKSACTRWKNGEMPNGRSLQKICDYFNVSKEYLLGSEHREISAILTLTDEEIRLIHAWRDATIREREDVAYILRERGFTYNAKKDAG